MLVHGHLDGHDLISLPCRGSPAWGRRAGRARFGVMKLDIAGRELAYQVYGSGKTVVLLHAFPFDGRMWRATAEALADLLFGGAGAGGGGLRIGDGIAQFCGAATLPAFRRRGIQTALLRRRLRDARGAGCDLGIMAAQPGSRSHFNAQRQGFSLLYSRAVLVKLPPAGEAR